MVARGALCSVLLLTALVVAVPPQPSTRTERQNYDPNVYDTQDYGGPQNSRPPSNFDRPGRPQNFGPPQDFGPGQDFGPFGPPQGFDQQIYDPQGFDPQGYRPQGQRPQGQRPQGNRPYANNPYTFPGLGAFNPLGGLGNALESIARYDDKKCVARMLCEVSAGGRPGGYRADSGGFFDLSALRGIAELMGAMTASPAASPMLMFGRAALLGATMRDPYRCYSSYPECPRDSDRLVDYLNNHNGGFFKLFNQQPGGDASAGAGNFQGGGGGGGYGTRRPPYRRGKKLRKQKYQQSGNDQDKQNDPNVRIQNDVPITDRTGTGELRLDTADLGNHGEAGAGTTGTRGGKALRFPRQDAAAAAAAATPNPAPAPGNDPETQASSTQGKKIVFPSP